MFRVSEPLEHSAGVFSRREVVVSTRSSRPLVLTFGCRGLINRITMERQYERHCENMMLEEKYYSTTGRQFLRLMGALYFKFI